MPRRAGGLHAGGNLDRLVGDDFRARRQTVHLADLVRAHHEQPGDAFDPATAARLEKFILSAGGSRPPEDLYLEFRGRMPGVEALLKGRGLLDAARCLPEAPLIGWDVLMTDGGYSILEANSPPGVSVWQVHAPLLADPRVARFFRAPPA